ncbi:MAG: FAD:protein FMN transferase [Bacilli bacterium]|nr:FAD:protein FMN transferase [Bacilli bacterium]
MKKLFVLICMIFLLTGCKTNMYKKSMFYMDTHIEVKLYDIPNETSKKLLKEIDNIYSEYHKLTDRYNEYEGIINVYYLNNVLKVNESIEIDSRLSDIINYGIDAYNKTNGYVNIALGNAVDVWKKYREEGKNIPKTYELLNLNVDIKSINLKDNTFIKKKDVKLDLGSYVKGYVTEIVAKYLEDNECEKYLINAGGNVRVGKSYKSSKYSVGLEEPFNVTNIYDTLLVENMSVVTSGSYQRYYEVDGVNYNHIINPKTLFPDNYTKSVTVVTKDSGYADILSTYLFLLPIEDGIKIVNSLDEVEAIWYADQIYYSESFNIYEQV